MKERSKLTENNVVKFLNEVDNFHDSVLVKMEYISGSEIFDDSVHPVNDIRNITVYVGKPDLKMKLHFFEVENLSLSPRLGSYDSIIYGCSLMIENGCVYWSDDEESTLEKPSGNIWIKAKKIEVEYIE